MRKIRQKGVALVLLSVFVVTMTGFSLAWAHRADKAPRIQASGERWEKRYERPDLDLTPEQEKELTRSRLTFREETLNTWTELMQKRIQLRKMWLSDAPDKDKIYELIDEMARIRARLNKKMVDHMLEIKGVLTPEQLEKLPLFSGFGWGMRYSSHLCR